MSYTFKEIWNIIFLWVTFFVRCFVDVPDDFAWESVVVLNAVVDGRVVGLDAVVGGCVIWLDLAFGDCFVVCDTVFRDCIVVLDVVVDCVVVLDAVVGSCVVALGNVVVDCVIVLDNVVRDSIVELDNDNVFGDCVVVLIVVCGCNEVLLDDVDDTDEDVIVPVVILLGDWFVDVLKVFDLLTSFGIEVTVGIGAVEPVVDSLVFIVASFAVYRVNEDSFIAVVFWSVSVVILFDVAVVVVNIEDLLDLYVVMPILTIVFNTVDVSSSSEVVPVVDDNEADREVVFIWEVDFFVAQVWQQLYAVYRYKKQ